jgi:3D (Asp-Asp-Asp) domain-containing protein
MTPLMLALLLSLQVLGFTPTVESFSVSAYDNSNGAPPFEGLTASGLYTREGYAACGPSFRFGTVFIIDGRGYICQDRGGAITDGHLDLWMETEASAIEWGRQEKWVIVVGEGR